MKSKKSNAMKPTTSLTNAQQQQQMNQQQQIPINNNVNVNSIFSNANQQMASNMQMPVQQMQMQMPAQQMPIPQMQQPVFNTPMNNAHQAQVRNVSGGFYGARQQAPINNQPPQEIPGIFNDDEALVQKAKQQIKEGKLQLQIKAQRSLIKLKNAIELPAMATLKSSGGSRTSVDLICVIDNSGSMSGQKIQLVKETIRFLLETLTPSDRLSIVTFNSYANRLCGLKCVTKENMQGFRHLVDGIQAGGGTNINSGLQLALKTIRDRKHINKVTSIFLLSDGQDKGAEHTFKASLDEQINKQIGVFTLHSFGFGSDHDQDLMTRLCEIKDGAFYFIKQLATLDQAFCNALGGIISLVASQVTIKINNISKNIVEGIKIKKVFGKMWEKINDRQYKIKLSQVMSGITKDFVFELQIPSINTQVGDVDRDHNIIEGIFTAKGVNKQNMAGQCVLKITLINQNQQIPDAIENVDVIQNYLRVKATEAIQENLKKADQQKYDEAQKGIDQMIEYIQSNKKARKDKMDHLVNDLNQIKQKCSKQDWASEGRKWMKNAQQAHSMQNNYQYSNCIQSQMVEKRKAMKKL